ncbi:hypothetical protein [Vibrio europaeus]|uniref:hypothetical protein n=1 Tax=Vibrio europaeus TaxID=300876 RepID=UPI0039E0B4D7
MDTNAIFDCLALTFERDFERIFVRPNCHFERWHQRIHFSTPLDLRYLVSPAPLRRESLTDYECTRLQMAAVRFVCGYFDQLIYQRPYCPAIDSQYQLKESHYVKRSSLLVRDVNAMTVDLSVSTRACGQEKQQVTLDCYGDINGQHWFFSRLVFFGHAEPRLGIYPLSLLKAKTQRHFFTHDGIPEIKMF